MWNESPAFRRRGTLAHFVARASAWNALPARFWAVLLWTALASVAVTAQEIRLGAPVERAESSPASCNAPAETKKETDKEAEKKKETCPSFWEKNPPVRIFPRLGNFPMLPSGPGFYSLADCVDGNWREKAPNLPYPAFGIIPYSFFDADFRYLDDPKNTQHDCFDCLHRIHLGPCWLFSTGGDFRWRYMDEVNSQLTGKNNTYDLMRTRAYTDLWYGNALRFYVEYIDAQIYNEDLAPQLIDRNHSDLLNAFVDLKVSDCCCYPAYVRVGRQEFVLGSQRLVSPADWANTRRTFQGVRGFRQGEKFDVDVFWVQPVLPSYNRFDSVDNNQNFAGLWTTYRPQKGEFFDMYYLFLDNTNTLTPLGATTVPYNVHTLGTRWVGDRNNWLWDFEGMYQFGQRGPAVIGAGAATGGLGYNWANCCWNPTFWAYYDYASGDSDPAAGTYHTFNQLFAFGHYYLGWLDLVGRRNIHDANMHLFLYPAKWVTVWLQYHNFRLDQARDALYNAAGVPIRRSPTGVAGTDVGNEIDLVLNFHVASRSDILLGYSHLFAGDFIRQTGPPGDAELFFVQFSQRW